MPSAWTCRPDDPDRSCRTRPSAPPSASPAELARQLRRPYKLVERRLAALRRAGGWFCPLTLPPCTECGETVVGPPRQRAHAVCDPARRARWAREEREQRARTLPVAMLAEQRSRATERAKAHYHDAPEDRKAALLAEAHERLQRDYGMTLEVADSSGQRWTEDDDRYIVANLDMPARELALALGRTNFADYMRRVKLRRRLEAAADKDPSTTSSSSVG